MHVQWYLRVVVMRNRYQAFDQTKNRRQRTHHLFLLPLQEVFAPAARMPRPSRLERPTSIQDTRTLASQAAVGARALHVVDIKSIRTPCIHVDIEARQLKSGKSFHGQRGLFAAQFQISRDQNAWQ